MKKFIAALGATTLSVAMAATSIVPANAAPVVPRVTHNSNVINVQEGGVPLRGRGEFRRSFRGGDFRRGMRADRREFRRDRREFRQARREFRRGDISRRDFRQARREFRRDRRDFRRGYWHDGRYGWYNGHRGYSYYRPGYRRYNDFWFPAAAFIGGAIVGGALASPAPVYRAPAYGYSQSHVDWCYSRYRSYRASDNTFQPYNGPRRECYSPYS